MLKQFLTTASMASFLIMSGSAQAGSLGTLTYNPQTNHHGSTMASDATVSATGGRYIVAAMNEQAAAPIAYRNAVPDSARLQEVTGKNAAGISHITGGIGSEEQAYFKQSKPNYNTYLLFVDRKSGAYLADVTVQVKDSKGQTVFDEMSEGPYFYLDLPNGSYTITASYEGVEKSHRVKVTNAHKAGQVKFVWDTPYEEVTDADSTL